MPNDVTKLVVKVGNQSDILFNSRTSKAYRAINVSELNSIVKSQQNMHIVIIESVKPTEYDSIKAFITTFKSLDSKNKVFFYVKDNDDTTCGIADELAYDIFLNLKDLHRTIDSAFGINIGTDLTTKTILTDKDSVSSNIDFDDTFDSSFGEVIDTINKTQSSVIAEEEVYELPNIESKDDLEILDESIIEDIETKEEAKVTVIVEEKTVHNENFDQVIIQLNAIKLEKSGLVSQLDTALDRIRHLTELNDALDDEKNTYKNMIDSLEQNNDIIEDPIGLSEYEGIVTELETLKLTHGKLQEQVVSGEINSDKLDEATTTIEQLKLNVKGLQTDIGNLQLKLTSSSDELENTIESYKEKLSAESMGRLKVTKLMTKAVNEVNIANRNLSAKIDEAYSLVETVRELGTQNSELGQQNSELEQLKIEHEQTIEELNTEIVGLNEKVKEIDTLILNAKAESAGELNQLRIEKVELNGKLDLISSQLAAKEYQYNNFVQTCGVDANGANTLLENNRTLEGVNKSLREQIIMTKNELDQSKREKIFAMQNAKNLEESNKQLKTSLNVITSGITAGAGIRIPPCNYTGKGMIIPVFGCGSFGITTTAMSIALKLATDAKVLYIDFDMIMPKADGWFKVNPIVKNVPDFDPLSSKFTGLGLFIDRQIQFFLSYAAAIVNKPIQTKGGSLDYISGFYARPDTIKLISADYTSFFNYCGNNYTYVVVDFGKLGCSELNDTLIKMVTDIAYRNVVVTTNDKFEIRTFSMKLDESGIDKNNVAWLVNLCESTNLEATSKKFISPAIPSMMPFNINLYGKKIDFTKDKLTRDKLDLFMKTIFNK